MPIVDPTLPHQLKIMYGHSSDLIATCNCVVWTFLFNPSKPKILDTVFAKYAEHLPKFEE